MKHLFRNCILILLAVLILLPAGRFCYADEVVFGDTDGDGELTEKDANCISDHFSRKRMMDAAAISRADCDSDGKITQNDVSMILKAMMSPETAIRATQSFSILVTSDLNGNAWMPTTSDGRASCSALNTTACIEALREENPNLLLFDAGGSIFGSAIADEYTDRTERGFGVSRLIEHQLTHLPVIDDATRRIDCLSKESIIIRHYLVFLVHHLKVEEADDVQGNHDDEQSTYHKTPVSQFIISLHDR